MKLKHHLVVLGSTRPGKTTTALKVLQEQKGLKFFINTKREAKWFKYMKYACYNAGNLETIFDNFDSYSDGIIQYIPDATDRKAVNKLEEVLDIILKRQQDEEDDKRKKVTIAVDEIQVYQSAHGCNETLARLWTMGLGLSIFAIGIAQRPQMVHFDLLANTENWILHAITPFDLDYLKKDKGVLSFEEYPEFLVSGEAIPHTAYMQTNKMIGLKKLW